MRERKSGDYGVTGSGELECVLVRIMRERSVYERERVCMRERSAGGHAAYS